MSFSLDQLCDNCCCAGDESWGKKQFGLGWSDILHEGCLVRKKVSCSGLCCDLYTSSEAGTLSAKKEGLLSASGEFDCQMLATSFRGVKGTYQTAPSQILSTFIHNFPPITSCSLQYILTFESTVGVF